MNVELSRFYHGRIAAHSEMTIASRTNGPLQKVLVTHHLTVSDKESVRFCVPEVAVTDKA
jgi:hypothetical protein